MSCWWDLDFSVTGPEPLIEQLKENLSGLKFDDGARLFHHVKIVRSCPASWSSMLLETITALQRFPS